MPQSQNRLWKAAEGSARGFFTDPSTTLTTVKLHDEVDLGAQCMCKGGYICRPHLLLSVERNTYDCPRQLSSWYCFSYY
jgi:hypothetical protein